MQTNQFQIDVLTFFLNIYEYEMEKTCHFYMLYRIKYFSRQQVRRPVARSLLL